MKVALAADWLVTFGGAEHVLAELHTLFPAAALFTTVARREKLGPLRDADIRTSSLQWMYRLTGQHQIFLSQMPRAMEHLDVRGYDVLISSSHAVGKGIVPESRTLHVCYCHTPMRYAWEMEEQYLNDFGVPQWLRPSIRWRLKQLRRWDLTTAKRVDVFLANSTTTQERIKRVYARESVVIPPPVEDRFFEAVGCELSAVGMQENSQSYFLAIGRLVPYKRFDLLVETANALRLPLWIAGRGQDEARLRKLAGPTIRFLGFVPDAELPGLYRNATALLFPQYEDAGIVLLEALASGTPAVAYKAGGAVDAVEEGVNGVFFEEQTAEALRDAIARFTKHSWDRDAIRKRAERFSQAKFRAALLEHVEGAWERFQRERR